MKLRYRLFLWVGIIFFVVFGLSLFLENYFTDKDVKNAENALRNKILEVNEQKRKYLEEYLHVSLTEDQAKVDALLLRIAQNPSLGAMLFLNPKDIQLETPMHSAYLFRNALFADYLQTTYHNQLTSLLIPIDFPMKTVHRMKIDDALSWFVLEDDQNFEHPYLGVQLSYKMIAKDLNLSWMMDELIEEQGGLTILFDPEGLLELSGQLVLEDSKKRIAKFINAEALLANLNHAIDYVRAQEEKWGKSGLKEGIEQQVRALAGNTLFSSGTSAFGIRCLQQEGEVLNSRIIELLQRKDQAIMVSVLASLFPEKIFGKSFLGTTFPQGVVHIDQQESTGQVILTNEVFFTTTSFNDQKYFNENPSTSDCKGVSSSIAIISSPDLERVFIGNTLELINPKIKEYEGYITVGIAAEDIVEDLVLSMHEMAFLVHDGAVINGFTKDGKKIGDPKQNIPFNKEMLASSSGLIDWKGIKYYFLHMIPFKNLDLHFFTLEPESEAFTLVRFIQDGTQVMLKNLSLSLRLIALIALILVLLLLNNVSKRITEPITVLATATEKVAKGQLENIELPKGPDGKNDEITILCNSFESMITGLKEKEKVKGVLNKIVSPEIAKEILKTNIHLGGEERKVTVLFADIRNFTGMSMNKPPHEVIAMLNTCMTRVSHVIDAYGGVIDKYVGDEVMALFGAPLAKEDSALKAVLCSLKVVEVLKQWNEERGQKGLPPVEMGIGIHTGNMVVGNMGAENRLNYTVIGSNVNLAARLCEAAKGMEILISKEILEQPDVKENIIVEQLPPRALKGFEGEFILYRVKGAKM